MIRRVRITLRLEHHRTTVLNRTLVFTAIRTIEEVAAIKLHSNLVAPHLDSATTLRLVQVGKLDNLAIVLAVDNPVMVIARTHSQLLVSIVYTLANGVWRTEIERRTIDRHNLARRDESAIDRRNVRRGNGERVVENRTATLAAQIKERVMRKVHHGRCIGLRLVGHNKLVSRRKGVGHLDIISELHYHLNRTVPEQVLCQKTVFRL